MRHLAACLAATLALLPLTAAADHCPQPCGKVVDLDRYEKEGKGSGLGAVAGGVAGGLLGNQIGGGSGRAVATVAGAAAGGYVGHEADKRHTKEETVTEMQRTCKTVVDRSEETIGYDVTYTLDGEEHTVRMEQDPGKQLKYSSLPAPAGG